jgi:hypothetical protein
MHLPHPVKERQHAKNKQFPKHEFDVTHFTPKDAILPLYRFLQ